MTFITFISELQNTNSSNDKKKILETYSEDQSIRKALYYILNPYLKYGISLDRLSSYSENDKYSWIWRAFSSVYDLLDELAAKTLTWYEAVESCIDFISNNDDENIAILHCALDKDLWSATWTSLVNKIFKTADGTKFIPEFNVSLATKIGDCLKWSDYLDFEAKRYVASRKLDGIRTVAIFNDNGTDVKFFSREGNEFLTLDVLKGVLLDMVQKDPSLVDFVIDWEVCIMNSDGIEDFKKIVWDIKRKNFTVEAPFYWIFDVISKKDFVNEYGDNTFAERFVSFSGNQVFETANSWILSYSDLLNVDLFNQWLAEARSRGWEGLIIRNIDAPYEGKRTKNMIKVKDFIDSEYEVYAIDEGTQPVLRDGVMVRTPVMSNVKIMHRGNNVDVGSWFSIEERIHFLKNPNDIIGKMITVQYFEESEDEAGNPSLRFPIFKGIRNYE